MPPKRRWTSSEKREVGARQSWRCAHCTELLPATYEIDHKVPLHLGGLDSIEDNAEALCNSCHASKTLRERVKMEARMSNAMLEAKNNQICPPPAYNKPVLDINPNEEFFKNRFLKYGFVKR